MSTVIVDPRCDEHQITIVHRQQNQKTGFAICVDFATEDETHSLTYENLPVTSLDFFFQQNAVGLFSGRSKARRFPHGCTQVVFFCFFCLNVFPSVFAVSMAKLIAPPSTNTQGQANVIFFSPQKVRGAGGLPFFSCISLPSS